MRELSLILDLCLSTDHTGMDREAKCSDTNGSSNSFAVSLTSLLVLIVTLVLER